MLELLFDGGEEELARGLLHAGASRRIGDRLHRSHTASFSTTVAHMLGSISITDAFAQAWQQYEALQEAASRTVGSGGEEVVELSSHTVASSWPAVLEWNPLFGRKGSMTFRVDLRAEVDNMTAVIREGRLFAIRSGVANVDTELAVDLMIVTRTSREVDLSSDISLENGIELVEPDAQRREPS